jgi:hypothetical protein
MDLWDHEVRLYKAPPPEVSTEQFYETYPGHGGKRRRRRILTAFPWPVSPTPSATTMAVAARAVLKEGFLTKARESCPASS